MPKSKGLLIVVDGPSGSGKDSLIATLAQELEGMGLPVVPFSEERLDKNRDEISQAKKRGGNKEMARVLLRHRKDLYVEYVDMAIELGTVVIANRGEPATEAYQTAGGELTIDEVWKMHRDAHIRIPDLVVITDCSPNTALARVERDLDQPTVRREQEGKGGLSGKVTFEQGDAREEKLRKQEKIHRQYEQTADFLEDKGVSLLVLNTERMSVTQEVALVVERLGLKRP